MAIAKTSEQLLQELRSLDVGQLEIAAACGIAECGCVYHAEDGVPCVHDLERLLAETERGIAQELVADATCRAQSRHYRRLEIVADLVPRVTFNGKPLQASHWE